MYDILTNVQRGQRPNSEKEEKVDPDKMMAGRGERRWTGFPLKMVPISSHCSTGGELSLPD